jgi:hypothetical protein
MEMVRKEKTFGSCFTGLDIHKASLELVRSYRELEQTNDDQKGYFKLLNVLSNLIYAFEIMKVNLDWPPPFVGQHHLLECEHYQKELNLKINTFDNYLKLRLESILKAQPISIRAEQINELIRVTFESVEKDSYIIGWEKEADCLATEASNFMKKISDECESRNPILIKWLLSQVYWDTMEEE